MVAVVLVSSSVKVWTADRFDRRAEGNADGFDLVVMVVDEVSSRSQRYTSCPRGVFVTDSPLFCVPHTSQVNRVVLSPEAPSSRFPQSVQKTSDPMAVIVSALKAEAL